VRTSAPVSLPTRSEGEASSTSPAGPQPPLHQEISTRSAAPSPLVPATPLPSVLEEETVEKQNEEMPDWEALSYADEEEGAEPAVTPQTATTPSSPGGEPTILSANSVPEQNEDTGPTLTLEEVKERWEYVKRRVKTRKGGAKVAAFLNSNGYSVVRVEGTNKLPVVVIMASSAFHYSGLQKKEDQDSVEWALKIELGRECGLRLLPPGSAGGTILPPVIPPPPPVSNRAASSAPPLSASHSAHIERPASPQNVAMPSRTEAQRQETHRTALPKKQDAPVVRDSSAPISIHQQAQTLARNPIVRENRSSNTDAGVENTPLPETKENVTTRLEFVTKKAKHDQVVQEVVRMFKAEIKDIHLK